MLLGYLRHFRPEFLDGLLGPTKNRTVLAFLSVALLSGCLFIPIQSRLMLTGGLTLLYLGFGSVLMLCLHVQGVLPRGLAKPFAQIGKGFAYVGMYSYSIYLWHLAVKRLALVFMPRAFHIQLVTPAGCVSYLAASIVFGILMSQLVEYPILRLRDRIFPAMQASPSKTTASEIKEASAPATNL